MLGTRLQHWLQCLLQLVVQCTVQRLSLGYCLESEIVDVKPLEGKGRVGSVFVSIPWFELLTSHQCGRAIEVRLKDVSIPRWGTASTPNERKDDNNNWHWYTSLIYPWLGDCEIEVVVENLTIGEEITVEKFDMHLSSLHATLGGHCSGEWYMEKVRLRKSGLLLSSNAVNGVLVQDNAENWLVHVPLSTTAEVHLGGDKPISITICPLRVCVRSVPSGTGKCLDTFGAGSDASVFFDGNCSIEDVLEITLCRLCCCTIDRGQCVSISSVWLKHKGVAIAYASNLVVSTLSTLRATAAIVYVNESKHVAKCLSFLLTSLNPNPPSSQSPLPYKLEIECVCWTLAPQQHVRLRRFSLQPQSDSTVLSFSPDSLAMARGGRVSISIPTRASAVHVSLNDCCVNLVDINWIITLIDCIGQIIEAIPAIEDTQVSTEDKEKINESIVKLSADTCCLYIIDEQHRLFLDCRTAEIDISSVWTFNFRDNRVYWRSRTDSLLIASEIEVRREPMSHRTNCVIDQVDLVLTPEVCQDILESLASPPKETSQTKTPQNDGRWLGKQQQQMIRVVDEYEPQFEQSFEYTTQVKRKTCTESTKLVVGNCNVRMNSCSRRKNVQVCARIIGGSCCHEVYDDYSASINIHLQSFECDCYVREKRVRVLEATTENEDQSIVLTIHLHDRCGDEMSVAVAQVPRLRINVPFDLAVAVNRSAVAITNGLEQWPEREHPLLLRELQVTGLSFQLRFDFLTSKVSFENLSLSLAPLVLRRRTWDEAMLADILDTWLLPALGLRRLLGHEKHFRAAKRLLSSPFRFCINQTSGVWNAIVSAWSPKSSDDEDDKEVQEFIESFSFAPASQG